MPQMTIKEYAGELRTLYEQAKDKREPATAFEILNLLVETERMHEEDCVIDAAKDLGDKVRK